jgi:hypothetical protein
MPFGGGFPSGFNNRAATNAGTSCDWQFKTQDACSAVMRAGNCPNFFAEALSLAYERNNDQFLMLPAGMSKYFPLAKTKLIASVSIWLQRQAEKNSTPLPLGNHVKPIIKLIKEICAIEQPDEAEGLKYYLGNRLERRPNYNLTTREILSDYLTYCEANGLAAYPECEFLDKLTKAIRETFGLTKVHNILRPHAESGKMTARYGFNNLGIKTKHGTEVQDVREVTEPTEGDIQQI